MVNVYTIAKHPRTSFPRELQPPQLRVRPGQPTARTQTHMQGNRHTPRHTNTRTGTHRDRQTHVQGHISLAKFSRPQLLSASEERARHCCEGNDFMGSSGRSLRVDSALSKGFQDLRLEMEPGQPGSAGEWTGLELQRQFCLRRMLGKGSEDSPLLLLTEQLSQAAALTSRLLC